MVMDEETLWILEMLSARKISARSADRILRALELLRKTEESKPPRTRESAVPPVPEEQATSAEMPQEVQRISPTEEELSLAQDSGIVIEGELEVAAEDAQVAEEEVVEEEFADVETAMEAEEEQEAVVIQEVSPSVQEPEEAVEEVTQQVEEIPSEAAVVEEGPALAEEAQIQKVAEPQEFAISDDVEQPAEALEAVQEPQEAAEEVAEEAEETPPTAAVVEEEHVFAEEARVREAAEPQEFVISDDVERRAEAREGVQEPEEAVEEVVEEVEETPTEAPPVEEEPPLAEEAQVEKEIETQEAIRRVPATVEEEITAEVTPEVARDTTKSAQEGPVWVEISDERSLLGDDGVGVIMDIPNGTEMILKKSAGNVTIRGWDQPHVRAEGEAGDTASRVSTVLRAEKSLKIKTENDMTLYIPPAIGRITVASGSGMIDIGEYSNDINVDSDTGDVNIREAGGTVKANSIEGSITLEDCCGEVSLKSESGDITVRKAAAIQLRNADGTIDLEKALDELLKIETKHAEVTETIADDALAATEVSVETGSGDIVLADVGGNMDLKSSGGKIAMERCRGRSIVAESGGGDLMLKDVANSVSLKVKNGNITVEDFLGEIRTEAENAKISLRNSGDAEIYIESDGSNITIEDCYADVYVQSGTGNVRVSGGTLSFGGMGKVDLKMKAGDAYLHRRTFENVSVVIEEGNAELNMEKLSSGGSGRLSVYRGDITVRVSPSFQCEVDAQAPRKKIHMELPVEVIEKGKSQLRGTLNGGGSKIELIAPNGEIRFQAL